MRKDKVTDNTVCIVENVIQAMQDKKAKKVLSLDLKGISDAVSDYFIICHGTSTTQVDAIFDNIIEKVQENCGTKPFHQEGTENSEWILIDYFDVVIHIFREDIREFYKLEDLWADAVITRYDDAE